MLEIIMISMFLLIIGHILFVLKRVDYSFTGVLRWYLNLLKRNKEVLNKKDKNKNLNKGIKTKEHIIPDNDTNLNNIFPFKIFEPHEMTKSERELRGKLIEKVKQKPSYFMENGKKKLIVPLEAIVFLNNDLNPLVNEYGEIIISIKEEKHAKLTGYKIVLEDTGEVLFENNSEIISALKDLDTLTKENELSIEDINEMLKEKIRKRNESELEEGIPDYLKQKELKVPEKEEFEEEFEEELPENILTEDELNDLLEEEIEESLVKKDNLKTLEDLIESEESEESEESVLEMLRNLKWQEIEGITFTPRDFNSFFNTNFASNENKNKLLINILKHKYLVFNDNKTAVYVDNIVLYDSISRLFGNDNDIILNKFAKMKGNIQKSFEQSFKSVFEEDISKRFSLNTFKNDNNCFVGYGVWFKLDSFKSVFKTEEEFDFFRSYRTNKYFVIGKSENCKSKLIPNKDNLIL